jgi:hypothetical protein
MLSILPHKLIIYKAFRYLGSKTVLVWSSYKIKKKFTCDEGQTSSEPNLAIFLSPTSRLLKRVRFSQPLLTKRSGV